MATKPGCNDGFRERFHPNLRTWVGLPLRCSLSIPPQREWISFGWTGSTERLARFSEAFLVLRAQGTGLKLGYVPVVMIATNVFYAGAAYPAGAAADRLNPRSLMLLGLTFLIAADLVLAFAASPLLVFAGASL